jgi:hypothetical protein
LRYTTSTVLKRVPIVSHPAKNGSGGSTNAYTHNNLPLNGCDALPVRKGACCAVPAKGACCAVHNNAAIHRMMCRWTQNKTETRSRRRSLKRTPNTVATKGSSYWTGVGALLW